MMSWSVPRNNDILTAEAGIQKEELLEKYPNLSESRLRTPAAPVSVGSPLPNITMASEAIRINTRGEPRSRPRRPHENPQSPEL